MNQAVIAVLSEVREFFTRHIHFASEAQADAIALWVAYTHWFANGQPFTFVPYLLVTSAERQSGKSTVLELAGMLVHHPLLGQDMSAALVARMCGGRTLLLDEIDGVYTGRDLSGDPSGIDLRTILNGGFKADGVYLRLDKGSLKPLSFPTFGPKMLSGIGRTVPETVQDRSIAIRMERKPHALPLPKVRDRLLRPQADQIKVTLADLGSRVPLDLEEDQSIFPDSFDGRREDIWEPLYALARVASDEWLERVIKASVVLTAAEPVVSLGVQLLADVRAIFEEQGDPPMIPTVDLIGKPSDVLTGAAATGLCGAEESPWATYSRGRPMTAHALARLMKEYGVYPKREPMGSGYGPKGYWAVDLTKPWGLYLADTSDTSDTSTETESTGAPEVDRLPTPSPSSHHPPHSIVGKQEPDIPVERAGDSQSTDVSDVSGMSVAEEMEAIFSRVDEP